MTEDTLLLDYKDQSVNVLRGDTWCLLWETSRIQQQTVWTKWRVVFVTAGAMLHTLYRWLLQQFIECQHSCTTVWWCRSMIQPSCVTAVRDVTIINTQQHLSNFYTCCFQSPNILYRCSNLQLKTSSCSD